MASVEDLARRVEALEATHNALRHELTALIVVACGVALAHLIATLLVPHDVDGWLLRLFDHDGAFTAPMPR